MMDHVRLTNIKPEIATLKCREHYNATVSTCMSLFDERPALRTQEDMFDENLYFHQEMEKCSNELWAKMFFF